MSHGQLIEFATPQGQTATGYLAGPTHAPTPPAGLIIVQEWWGLVPHITELVDRFAAAGYRALAPDLYHGKSTVEAEEASHLMHGLDWARAAGELSAAAEHLRTAERVSRVGVVGFCMGGALAMLAAARGGVDAYVSFYGFPPDANAVAQITAPGLLLFGEREEAFNLTHAKDFVDAQRKKGVETEIVIYPGAGHAFFNDTRTAVYRPDAAADAWSRTLDWFGSHLS
jgi:carboxymethylenebutenolidase